MINVDLDLTEFEIEEVTRPIPYETIAEVNRRWRAELKELNEKKSQDFY